MSSAPRRYLIKPFSLDHLSRAILLVRWPDQRSIFVSTPAWYHQTCLIFSSLLDRASHRRKKGTKAKIGTIFAAFLISGAKSAGPLRFWIISGSVRSINWDANKSVCVEHSRPAAQRKAISTSRFADTCRHRGGGIKAASAAQNTKHCKNHIVRDLAPLRLGTQQTPLTAFTGPAKRSTAASPPQSRPLEQRAPPCFPRLRAFSSAGRG